MKPIAITLVAILAIAAAAAACGGSETDAGVPSHVHEDGTAHNHDSSPRVSDAATPIPRYDPNSYPGCMEALGYVFEANGDLTFPDGTVWREPGLFVLYQRPIGLRNDEYDCRVKSGLEGAAAAAGYVQDLPSEEEVALLNEFMISVVQCLTGRGWDIAPLVVRKDTGTLTYQHTPVAGDLAALELDRLECEALSPNGAE